MPITPTYPGVYIEEVPSGVRTITGVATAVGAFLGYFSRGPINEAVRIFNFGDFERAFGGLRVDSEASYAIQQFFLNGGGQAWVVRVAGGAPAASTATLETGGIDVLVVDAASEGVWGDDVSVAVDYNTADTSPGSLQFNVSVTEAGGAPEVFRNLVMDPASPAYAVAVINAGSRLVQVQLPDPPDPSLSTLRPAEATTPLAGGDDGTLPGALELLGDEDLKEGMYALLDVDLFNILCIPDTMRLGDADAAAVATQAIDLCEEERAFYILDVPQPLNPRDEPTEIETWLDANASLRHRNAALYFPRPEIPDPLNEFRLRSVAPSGTLAGLYARTDANRGVWKAPAGTEAVLRGVQRLEYRLTDAENGIVNPLGINALRTFPVFGNISWGARTLEGADQLASEWKYIPIRRLALFIEESLFRGTQWVVFEPNDEPLWAQIRLNVGTFMNNLFRQGAFQGASPREAYFVRCDHETNPQADIDRGIVNILVGFAPLKPAEFVIIKIQQIAKTSE